MPRALVEKNGRKTLGATAGSMPGPLSHDVDPQRPLWQRRRARREVTTGGSRRSTQASSALRHRLLNACRKQHLVTFDRVECAANFDAAAARGRFSPDLVGRPLDNRAHVDGCERQFRWLGEVQKVGDDLSERVGFVANALHVRLEFVRQALGIEQATVAVNRRQAVSELVSDPGSQFAESRQAVLQA